MILGIGTDIVQIPRIERILDKYGLVFIDRLLSPEEKQVFLALSAYKAASYIAKRFAGKEAFLKAIGVGMGNNVRLTDISILNDPKGKPYLTLNNCASSYVSKTKISLADDYPTAVAFVVLTE